MILRRHIVSGGLAAFAAGCSRKLSKGFPGYVFVANSDGQAVAAVDLEAFAVIRHIRLDANPLQVVALQGKPFVYALTPRTATIHEISVEKLEVTRRVRLTVAPGSMQITPDGAALFVLCPDQRQLLRVTTANLQVSHRLPLTGSPTTIDFAPEDNSTRGLVAVGLGDTGQAALVDGASGKLLRTIALGSPAGALIFRKDGARLIASHPSERTLSQFDVASGRCVVRLPLAVRPDHLCVKPDGGEIYITGEGADALVTVYPFRTEVRGTLLAGRAPGYVAAATNRVFVANPQTNDVTVIDSRNQRVVAVARVGKEPCFIALTPAPDYSFALVLNRQSGDVSVLRAASVAARRSNTTPVAPAFMIPVGSAPSSAVVWGG